MAVNRADALARVVETSVQRKRPALGAHSESPSAKMRHVEFDAAGGSAAPTPRGGAGNGFLGLRCSRLGQRDSIAHVGHGRVSVTSAAGRTKLFHGLYAAVVTPLAADGSVNLAAVEPYAKHLRADGVNGVFVAGTAGMSMSLSVAERKALLEAWVAAGKRHSLEVLAHVGAQSLADSAELARHAEDAGAAAVSAMAPCFFKPAGPAELAAYLREVAAAAPYTPFLYYHFPEITGVNISMRDAMKALHEQVPTLRGGKFTSTNMWDLGDTLDLGHSLGLEWDLMMGYEGQTASALPLGITAHIGISFSVVGPVWNRMVRAFEAGKHDEVSALQQVGREWFDMFAKVSGLWSMTHCTKMMLQDRTGVDFGGMRLPQKCVSSEDAAKVQAGWAEFKRSRPTLFEHSGPLAPPKACTVVKPPAADVDIESLPGFAGQLDEEIKQRCAAVARELQVDIDAVFAALPHLMHPKKRTAKTMPLPRAIDHTLLKAEAKRADVSKLCTEAKQHGFYAVCVNGSFVHQAADETRGSGVRVAAVIGFPLGAMSTRAKALETEDAVEAGAAEIDMVLHVGNLQDGDYSYVFADIYAVVEAAARGGATVKVIFETCLLNRQQIIDACIISALAGAEFVKTSTGFSKGGATLEAVDIMKATVGDVCRVKASGGVRDAAAAQKYIALGAERLGTSSGVAIVSGQKAGGGY